MTRLLPHFDTIYGVDGEHPGPYLTRMKWGRIRFHLFHRGDLDRDPHNHPFGFVTFPLRGYVEEVFSVDPATGEVIARKQVVRSFRFHHRPATHLYVVLGKLTGYDADGKPMWTKHGKFATIVFTTGDTRVWQFLKNRDGQWCWIPWKQYLFEGGKHAACEPGPETWNDPTNQPEPTNDDRKEQHLRSGI